MQPNSIKTLGFKFFGGNIDDCMFMEHPKTIKETLTAIKTAREMLKDSGSKWFELTMIAKEGHKELVKMYAEQSTTPVAAPMKPSDIYTASIDDDPYQWSYGK